MGPSEASRTKSITFVAGCDVHTEANNASMTAEKQIVQERIGLPGLRQLPFLVSDPCCFSTTTSVISTACLAVDVQDEAVKSSNFTSPRKISALIGF
jgi:hypothetical protein